MCLNSSDWNVSANFLVVNRLPSATMRVYKKIQDFMLVSDLKKYLKNSKLEKVVHMKPFFRDVEFFYCWKIIFWDYIFSADFFLNFN